MLYGIVVTIKHENLWVKLFSVHDFAVSDILFDDECLTRSKRHIDIIVSKLKEKKADLNITKISIAHIEKV